MMFAEGTFLGIKLLCFSVSFHSIGPDLNNFSVSFHSIGPDLDNDQTRGSHIIFFI